MAKFTTINDASLVQAVTATEYKFPLQINNKQVVTHLYTFAEPALELVQPTRGFELRDTTLYDHCTSYGVAVALYVNSSALAIPIFQIEQDPELKPLLNLQQPTLVGDISSTGTYFVMSIDDINYGLPLYTFGSLLNTRTNTFETNSAINVTTVIDVGKPTLDITLYNGSTYLNPKIEAYSDLLERIKRLLGWPSMNIDLCDENIAGFIDQAVELYTKYAGYTEEYLLFNTSIYKTGRGIKLDDLFSCTPELFTTLSNNTSASFDYDLKDYRKVLDIWSFEQGESTGINTLFTLEQAMVQQVYYGNLLGSFGFDLITWHITKDWLETREKVLAQKPLIRFNARTQYMTILPEPMRNQNYYGAIGAYVEKPIRDLIAEPWVIFYVQALAKIAIGNLRTKYQGQVIFGGGTVNGNDLLNQGLKEKEELEKQLLTGQGFADVEPPKFFMG
jgi:hypothetical protein